MPSSKKDDTETTTQAAPEVATEKAWWQELELKEDPTGKTYINPNDSAEFTVIGKADSPIAAQHPIKINYRPVGGNPHDTEMSVEYFNQSQLKA